MAINPLLLSLTIQRMGTMTPQARAIFTAGLSPEWQQAIATALASGVVAAPPALVVNQTAPSAFQVAPSSYYQQPPQPGYYDGGAYSDPNPHPEVDWGDPIVGASPRATSRQKAAFILGVVAARKPHKLAGRRFSPRQRTILGALAAGAATAAPAIVAQPDPDVAVWMARLATLDAAGRDDLLRRIAGVMTPQQRLLVLKFAAAPDAGKVAAPPPPQQHQQPSDPDVAVTRDEAIDLDNNDFITGDRLSRRFRGRR
jgi:hypothetical protein